MSKLKELIKKHTTLDTRVKLTRIASKIIGKPFRWISEGYEGMMNRYPAPAPAKSGWSVMVLTSGKNKECFDKFVHAAYDEFKGVENYEIIVVGPPSLDFSHFPKDAKIVLAPFYELNLWSIPFAISKKKNLGARYAKYDKLAISHDYLYFLPGWKEGWDKFGDDFIVSSNITVDQDGVRHKDWVTWDYPGIGVSMIPYNVECTQYQVMGGNFVVVKRDFFVENPMPPRLRWGEDEQLEWSFRVRKMIKFNFNTNSTTKYSKYKKGNHIGPWLENTRKIEEIYNTKPEDSYFFQAANALQK